MKVLFINNDGAGFADYVEIQPNTSVQSFFDQRCSGKPANYLIRQPVPSDNVLQEDDRISVTPTKIEGAA